MLVSKGHDSLPHHQAISLIEPSLAQFLSLVMKALINAHLRQSKTGKLEHLKQLRKGLNSFWSDPCVNFHYLQNQVSHHEVWRCSLFGGQYLCMKSCYLQSKNILVKNNRGFKNRDIRQLEFLLSPTLCALPLMMNSNMSFCGLTCSSIFINQDQISKFGFRHVQSDNVNITGPNNF